MKLAFTGPLTLFSCLLLHMSQGKAQSYFLKGDLGVVSSSATSDSFLEDATAALMKILKEHVGATGEEKLIPGKVQTTNGQTHIRYKEAIIVRDNEEIPVEGAALMMHIGEKGVVFAVNGEFASAEELKDYEVTLDCESAMGKALQESGIIGGTWRDNNCDSLAIVNDQEGRAHIAWKRQVDYGGYQSDLLYGSTMTGKLVARYPQVMTTAGVSGGINPGFAGGIKNRGFAGGFVANNE